MPALVAGSLPVPRRAGAGGSCGGGWLRRPALPGRGGGGGPVPVRVPREWWGVVRAMRAQPPLTTGDLPRGGGPNSVFLR